MPAKRLTAKTVLLSMVLTSFVCLLTGESRDRYSSHRQQRANSLLLRRSSGHLDVQCRHDVQRLAALYVQQSRELPNIIEPLPKLQLLFRRANAFS